MDLKKYTSRFSEKSWWSDVGRLAKRAGIRSVYTGLLMFYAFKRKETPHWAKNIIVGSLGYLLTPIDVMPDLTPILGYTDDLGILSFGLVTIGCYINDQVRDNAQGQLSKWFRDIPQDDLDAVHEKLGS